MAEGRLLLGARRYSSWSLRGWLAVRLAGLAVEEEVMPVGRAGADSVIAQRSPSGLVPYLEHDGSVVWESLAIVEYCAEFAPSLWPAERAARAWARAISAEMHAGFRALRQSMPMILAEGFAGRGRNEASLADVARVETLWRATRERFGAGGPFLFGAGFGGADVMFAPVVTRLLTFAPPLADDTSAYCAAVRAHPLVDEWYRLAAAEPAEWRVAHYESVV